MNETIDHVQQWIAKKLSRQYNRLREATTATYTYRRIAGPKAIFGEVALSADHSDSFSFSSKVTWPENENCDEFVVDGILDVLLVSDFYPVLGARFTLEKIGWHEIESVPIAYYFAAREATKKILKLDEKNRNFSMVIPHDKGNS